MKAKQQEKVPFKINLQLFGNEPNNTPSPAEVNAQALAFLKGGNSAEGAAPTQGQQPPTAEGNPQNSPQPQGNGGQTQVEGQGQPTNQPAGTEQPGQQAPNPQEQMILGKFKSPDDLANGYVNLEKFATQARQEALAKDQQIQAMQQAMEQMKQQIGNVVNPQQQQAQPTPEEMNEQFMNSFYENPTQSIQQMIKQALEQSIMPQIAPIQQQYQQQQQQQAWNQAKAQFSQQTPDMQQFEPVMEQILAQRPELSGHPGGPMAALDIAYNMAKGQQYQDPNSLLQNQDFVKQNILNNPDIEKQIIEKYLQSLKQGNQAPTVISGQVNGSTPVVPENKPQNLKDARAMALKYMQG